MVLVGRNTYTIWLLYTICLLNRFHGNKRALLLPKARHAFQLLPISLFCCIAIIPVYCLPIPLQFLPGLLKVISSISFTINKCSCVSISLKVRMSVVLECSCGAVYCYSWRSQQLMCMQYSLICHAGAYKHIEYSTGCIVHT